MSHRSGSSASSRVHSPRSKGCPDCRCRMSQGGFRFPRCYASCARTLTNLPIGETVDPKYSGTRNSPVDVCTVYPVSTIAHQCPIQRPPDVRWDRGDHSVDATTAFEVGLRCESKKTFHAPGHIWRINLAWLYLGMHRMRRQ